MTITSLQLTEYAAMIDAVGVAISENSEAMEFLASLHEKGFMVVPVPEAEPKPPAKKAAP